MSIIDRKKKRTGGFDASAKAYFTSASITNGGEKQAVNTLIKSLKSSGVWAKIDRIYLCSRTSSTAAKKCAKSLTSLTVASGSPTFSASGWTFNGSTDAFDTGFKATGTSVATVQSIHLSAYVPYYQQRLGSQFMIGATDNVHNSINRIYMSDSSKYSVFGDLGSNAFTNQANVALDHHGFFIASRTGATAEVIYQNGTSVNSQSTNNTGVSLCNVNYFLGSDWDGTAQSNYFQGLINFWSIGAGLSAVESAAFNAAVQAYQTSMSNTRHWVARKLFALGPYNGYTAPAINTLSDLNNSIGGGSEFSPAQAKTVTLTGSVSGSGGSNYLWAETLFFAGGNLNLDGQAGSNGSVSGGIPFGGQGGQGMSGGGGGAATFDSGGSSAPFEGGGSEGSNAGDGSQGNWSGDFGSPGSGGSGFHNTPSFSLGGIPSGGAGGNAGISGGTGAAGGGGGGGQLFAAVLWIFDTSGLGNISVSGGAAGTGDGDVSPANPGQDGYVYMIAMKKIGTGVGLPSNLQLFELAADGVSTTSRTASDTWDNT